MRKPQLYCFIRLILIVLLIGHPTFVTAQEESSTPTEQTEEKTHPFADFEPEKQEKYDFWSEFMSMLSTLAFIIFLLLVAAWVMRRALNARMESVNQTSAIRILERRTISPKASIYLLEVLGTGFLIAETQAGIHRIAQLPEGSDLSGLSPAATMASGRSFESMLDQNEE